MVGCNDDDDAYDDDNACYNDDAYADDNDAYGMMMMNNGDKVIPTDSIQTHSCADERAQSLDPIRR